MLLSKGFPYEVAFIIFVGLILVLLAINLIALVRWARKRKKVESIAEVKPYALDTPHNYGFLKGIVYRLKVWVRYLTNFWRKNIRALFISANVLLVIAIGYLFYDLFVNPLGVVYSSPQNGEVWGADGSNVEILFDRAFKPELLEFKILPETKGSWQIEHNGIPFLPRKLKFIPEETIFPGESVLIYVAHVSNLIETDGVWDKIIEVDSPPIPKVLGTDLDAESSQPRGTTDPIMINLDAETGDYVNWEFEFNPAVEFTVNDTNKTQLKINFTSPLAQNTTYQLVGRRSIHRYAVNSGEIVESLDPEKTLELSFTTVKAPALAAQEPTGNKVRSEAIIKLTFDKDMVKESVDASLKLEPETAVTTVWEGERTLVITPSSGLAKGTDYKVIIPKGVKSIDKGALEADIVHTFTTIGHVYPESTSPRSGSTNVSATTSLKVVFNQDVDKQSAQDRFSINPNLGGKFSWEGNNVLVWKPNGEFGYSTKYSVTISAGVKTVYGLDQKDNFSFSFTTRPQEVILSNFPYMKQQYRFACNVTAASMALKYKGVSLGALSIRDEIGVDSRPYNSATNSWGDPNVKFVGDINYQGSNNWDPATGQGGYGVHWAPVLKVIKKYRPNSVGGQGYSVSSVLKEVEAGHPVIIWAHNDLSSSSGNSITWKSLDTGNSISTGTKKGMHSYVVVGFKGSPESPSLIYVANPGQSASRASMSVGTFQSLLGVFGGAAVVVK